MPKRILVEINPEEAELFRKNVGTVQALKQDKHLFPIKKNIRIHSPQATKSTAYWQPSPDSADWLNAEDKVHFARNGLQRKIIQRLKQGRILIETKIDLHGRTVSEAIDILPDFINDCLRHQRRWVLIIHGKGNFSTKGKPILKNFLNEWLQNQSEVLAFHSAPPKWGGNGALVVLLLKKRTHHEK